MSKEKIISNGRPLDNEKKNCTDCLNCKVSAISTTKCRLCFCVNIGRKALLQELYWRKKTPCRNFEDMSA